MANRLAELVTELDLLATRAKDRAERNPHWYKRAEQLGRARAYRNAARRARRALQRQREVT